MIEKETAAPNREAEFKLMQRIASGDTDAFEEFHEKYHVLIHSTVFKVLNHHQDTEDVTNEVLSTMWSKAGIYRPDKGSLVTWICTTARNRAIDRIRSLRRRSLLHDRFGMSIEQEENDGQKGALEDCYVADARRILQNAVVTLSAEQREVVEMVYFEGLTQRQVADRLESPLGTVKARLRRGVEKLRTVIGDQYDEEGKLLLHSLS